MNITYGWAVDVALERKAARKLGLLRQPPQARVGGWDPQHFARRHKHTHPRACLQHNYCGPILFFRSSILYINVVHSCYSELRPQGRKLD